MQLKTGAGLALPPLAVAFKEMLRFWCPVLRGEKPVDNLAEQEAGHEIARYIDVDALDVDGVPGGGFPAEQVVSGH